MRFLVEQTLTEDIWALKKYYPKMDDKQFIKYLQLDPTYKGGDNAGNYAKWILSLANKGKLDRPNHVYDILNRFNTNKNRLKTKDIFQFKTIDDLENYLNDENNYNELSRRQELRQTQKTVRNTDVNKDAELVYEDSKWEVWIPHTYEASCKLGQGSRWCTATTDNDYYYNQYTYSGILYININKTNRDDKYQFHFASNQFMNKDDDSINLNGFLAEKGNEGLKTFYNKTIADNFVKLNPDWTSENVSLQFGNLADHFSDRYMTRDSYLSLLQGDLWDWFGYQTADVFDEETFEQYYKDEIYETNRKLLADLGVDIESNFSTWPENIRDAVGNAWVSGWITGTEEACLTDFNDSLHNAFNTVLKYGETWEYGDDCIIIHKPKEVSQAILNDILKFIQSDDPYENDFDLDSASYSAIILSKLEQCFEFYEPQSGWEGFSDETFNSTLTDNLNEL